MTDKVKDLVIRGTGGAESTAPVVLHDNGDGTFSEGVYPGVVHTVSDDTALQPTNAGNTGVNSHVAKNNAGWLMGFSVHNAKTAAQWVMLFDALSLPADTSTAFKMVWPIDAQDTISIDYGIYGRYCSTGIVLALSTTETQLTVATDSKGTFDSQVV